MATELRNIMLKFRARASDSKRWQAAADRRRIPLSEWIRDACDAISNMETASEEVRARRPKR